MTLLKKGRNKKNFDGTKIMNNLKNYDFGMIKYDRISLHRMKNKNEIIHDIFFNK